MSIEDFKISKNENSRNLFSEELKQKNPYSNVTVPGITNFADTQAGSFKNPIYSGSYGFDIEPFGSKLSDGSFSFKDQEIRSSDTPESLEERYSSKQSTFEKWQNGIAKAVTKAGIYATDALVGTAYGIVASIAEGNFNTLYDNDFSNAIDDLNTKLDNTLPNYYSEYEKQAGFLSSVGTANFWANDFLGGLSFLGGTVLSEGVLGLATGGASLATTLPRATLKAAIKKGAKQAGKKTLGYTAKKELINTLKDKVVRRGIIGEGLDLTGFAARSSIYEAGMEARLATKESIENYISNYKQTYGEEPSGEELTAFISDAKNASNGVFAANMAILIPSNLLMFGKLGTKSIKETSNSFINNKLFGLGYNKVKDKAGKLSLEAIKPNALQKITGNSYQLLKGPVTEGLWEEGMQGVATKTMMNYLGDKYNSKNNIENLSLTNSFYDAFAEQYGTSAGWKENLLGSMIGAVGGSFTSFTRGLKGGLGNALKNTEGIGGFGKQSYRSMVKENVDNVNAMNKVSENMLERANSLSAISENVKRQQVGDSKDISYTESQTYGINEDWSYINTMAPHKTKDEIKEDYAYSINNMEISSEVQKENGFSEEQIEQYKKDKIEKFNSRVDAALKAKQAVKYLNLDLGVTPGNKAAIEDAFAYNLYTGTNSLENAKDLSSQLDNIVGKEGTFSAINYFNNLTEDQKKASDRIKELKEEIEGLKAKSFKLAKLPKLSTFNSTTNKTETFAEKQRQTNLEIVKLTDLLNDKEAEKAELESKLDKKVTFNNIFGKSEDILGQGPIEGNVTQMFEDLEAVDSYIKSLEEEGLTVEANSVSNLLKEIKFNLDSSREVAKQFDAMSRPGFFKKKGLSKLLETITGDKYSMSEDTIQLIRDNDEKVRKSLALSGLVPTKNTEDYIKEIIEGADNFSDKNKFHLEMMIRNIIKAEDLEFSLPEAPTSVAPLDVVKNGIKRSGAKLKDIEVDLANNPSLDYLNEVIDKIIESSNQLGDLINLNDPRVKEIQTKIDELKNEEASVEKFQKIEELEIKLEQYNSIEPNIAKADIEKRKPLEKSLERIENILDNDKKLKPEKQAIEILNQVFLFRKRNKRIGLATKEELAQMDKFEQEAKEKFGLEIDSQLGTEYDERRFVDVKDFIDVKNSQGDKSLITTERRPQINKNGVLVQRALVDVSQGLSKQQYDAELAELKAEEQTKAETITPTSNQSDIETKKQALEKEIESLNSEVTTIIKEKETLPEYNSEDLENQEIDRLITKRLEMVGQPSDLFEDYTNALDNAIERIKNGTPTDPAVLKKTIDYIYAKVKEVLELKKLENKKDRILKNLTLTTLNDIYEDLSEVLEHLLEYENKQRTNESLPIFISKKTNEDKTATSERTSENIRRNSELTEQLISLEAELSALTAKKQELESEDANEKNKILIIKKEIESLKNQVSDEIETLEKSIISLKSNNKFKPEVKDYKRLETLLKKQDRTDEENSELENLKQFIDQWIKLDGTVADGVVLSDLIEQKIQLESQDVVEETPVTNQTDSEIFESSNSVAINGTQGFTVSFNKLERGKLAITGISFKGLIEKIDPLNKSQLPQEVDSGDVVIVELEKGNLEITVNEVGGLEIKKEQIELINSTTIKVINTSENQGTNFNVTLEENESGVKAVESDFGGDYVEGDPNEVAIYETQVGEEVTLKINLEDKHNQKLINSLPTKKSSKKINLEDEIENALEDDKTLKKLNKELSEKSNLLEKIEEKLEQKNTTDVKAKLLKEKFKTIKKIETLDSSILKRENEVENTVRTGSTSKKISKEALAKLKKELVISVYTNRGENGNFTGTLKSQRGLDKDSVSIDTAKFNALRDQLVDKYLDTILEGSTETITLTETVSVQDVYLGHPNYNFERKGSKIVTRFDNIPQNRVKDIVDIGFIEKGSRFLRNKTKDVDTTFISKFKKNKGKTGIIVLNHFGRNIAYPVNTNERNVDFATKLKETFYGQKPSKELANNLNDILIEAGVDIKKEGFVFVSEKSRGNNLNDKEISNKVAQLEEKQYFYNLENWESSDNNMENTILNEMKINIDLNKPFHSPKFMLDFSKIEVKIPENTVIKKSKGSQGSSSIADEAFRCYIG